jgi:hypothetical protein
MSNKTRIKKIESVLHGGADKPAMVWECIIDPMRGDEAEQFVPFKDDFPCGETIGFDVLRRRAKLFDAWIVLDLKTCAHKPCASPYFVVDGKDFSAVLVDDSTLHRWGTFKRGDFLRRYQEHHDAGREARAQLVAENSESLAAFANRTPDEWRAILGFAAHAAMTTTDHNALHAGRYADLDTNRLDFVLARCGVAERIASLIELEKRFPFTWRDKVWHALDDVDRAALMSGDFQTVSDAGIAEIERQTNQKRGGL